MIIIELIALENAFVNRTTNESTNRSANRSSNGHLIRIYKKKIIYKAYVAKLRQRFWVSRMIPRKSQK